MSSSSSSSSTCWSSQLCVDSNGVHEMTNANWVFLVAVLSFPRSETRGRRELITVARDQKTEDLSTIGGRTGGQKESRREIECGKGALHCCHVKVSAPKLSKF